MSVKEKNISFNPIDVSAKALASPIIGHRGHPAKAERRHFRAGKFVVLIPPL